MFVHATQIEKKNWTQTQSSYNIQCIYKSILFDLFIVQGHMVTEIQYLIDPVTLRKFLSSRHASFFDICLVIRYFYIFNCKKKQKLY